MNKKSIGQPLNYLKDMPSWKNYYKGYTKNHAMKKMPIPSSTTVRWGNTAGLIGLTYRLIDSIDNDWKKQKLY